MAFQMEVVAERAAAAYAETVEATTGIQVFGTPGNAVIKMLRRQAEAGVPLSTKPHHLGGFMRLWESAPRYECDARERAGAETERGG